MGSFYKSLNLNLHILSPSHLRRGA